MRKTITALLMLMSLNSFSQWRVEHIDGDELTETQECNAFIYENDDVIFWFHDLWDDHFNVASKKGNFYWKSAGPYYMVNTIIGLYEADGKLKKKITMLLDAKSDKPYQIGTRHVPFMSRPQGQGKKSKEILKHIKETDGYIRIIAQLYGKKEFDATIPNYKSALRE